MAGVSSSRIGAAGPHPLAVRLVERLAQAQVDERVQRLRLAGLLHPDPATGVELLEAADLPAPE